MRGAREGGGHPQGVPLRLDKGVPARGEGTHKGCPYGWIWGAREGGRAPTRGAPTVGYGVHAKGGGRPQGAPLRLDEGCPRGGRAPTRGAPTGWMMGCTRGGRAPTRGAPTGWMMGCTRGGEGTHKGRPYGWMMWARTRGEGFGGFSLRRVPKEMEAAAAKIGDGLQFFWGRSFWDAGLGRADRGRGGRRERERPPAGAGGRRVLFRRVLERSSPRYLWVVPFIHRRPRTLAAVGRGSVDGADAVDVGGFGGKAAVGCIAGQALSGCRRCGSIACWSVSHTSSS